MASIATLQDVGPNNGSLSSVPGARRSSRLSSSSNAAIAIPVSPRVIAAALDSSALADDDDEDDDDEIKHAGQIDIRARYGRRASKNAERSESMSLRRPSNNNSARRPGSDAANTKPAFQSSRPSTTKDSVGSTIRRMSSRPGARPDLSFLNKVSKENIPDETTNEDDEVSPPPLSSTTFDEATPQDGGNEQSARSMENLEMDTDNRDTGTLGSTRGMLIMAVTGVAQLLDNVSMTSVNIALPDIGESLDIRNGDLQWLISGYTLTFGGFLLLAGVMADRYGKKKVFLGSMLWLSFWTLIDGFATTEIQLIIFRALQGLGAAGTVPAAIGIISSYFVGHDRNRALSIFGACGAVGFVVGLVAGGVFTSLLNWRYIFRITAPLGVGVAVMGYFVLPKDKKMDGPKPALDFLGAALGTGGLILLTFCLSSGGVVGWSKAYIIALIIVSIAMLLAFTYAEKKVKQPIMPLYLWRTPNFAATWFTGFLAYSYWQLVVLYIVLTAQDINHLGPLETAARYAPMGLVGLIVSIATGRVIHLMSVKTLLTVGMIICAVSVIPIAVMDEKTSFWLSCFPVSILGVAGISISYNTISIAMMAAVPPAAKSLAGGLANTSFQLGSGVGLAITSAVSQAVLKDPESAASVLKSYQAAMWTCSGFAGLGAVLTVFGVKPGRLFVSGPVAH